MPKAELAAYEFVEDCELEWHRTRGVLYVHNKDTGATVLRISGLKRMAGTPMLPTGCIDIKAGGEVNYPDDRRSKL